MLSTRLAQNTGYALSHQTWDHLPYMFMLLNTATIRIIYAIVSPCKLGAIDNHIRNFTQQLFILQVMYALSKFS